MKSVYEGSNGGYLISDDDELDAHFTATARRCDCCQELFLPEDLTETEAGGMAIELCEDCLNLKP